MCWNLKGEKQKTRGKNIDALNLKRISAALLLFTLGLLPFAFGNPQTAPLKQPGDQGSPQSTWQQALPPFVFRFPADHASHDDYKLEWWYYTGNLSTKDGRRFGYQLTFFRLGVEQKPQNPSRWAVRDLYAAHLAVTDINGKKFHFADKLSRAGIGFAGSAPDRYHVWNETWSAELNATGEHILQASDKEMSLSFTLAPGKAPVIQGENGVSQKGAQPGNASHYYSLTRMPTRGTLTLGGERFEITGESWMDHEFGTSYLEAGQLGWDWFSLQLDDGSELMLYRFRRQDGSLDKLSSGTLVDAAGNVTRLAFDDFTLKPMREWASDSGARYPVEWQVNLPKQNMDLKISAAIDQQEMRTEGSTGVSYWEGAIEIQGAAGGRKLAGRGYLEMTGYAGKAMGAIMQ